MAAGRRYFSESANWTWRASLRSRSSAPTSQSESTALGSRFSIANIRRRTGERNCLRGSDIRNLLQVGMFAFSLVKHSDGRNKLSYCPISSLLLKIRFCQKSVLLIIGVKISSHDSPSVVDSEWECG